MDHSGRMVISQSEEAEDEISWVSTCRIAIIAHETPEGCIGCRATLQNFLKVRGHLWMLQAVAAPTDVIVSWIWWDVQIVCDCTKLPKVIHRCTTSDDYVASTTHLLDDLHDESLSADV
jgi:hypothetical protein